jgi:hypothetical protein
MKIFVRPPCSCLTALPYKNNSKAAIFRRRVIAHQFRIPHYAALVSLLPNGPWGRNAVIRLNNCWGLGSASVTWLTMPSRPTKLRENRKSGPRDVTGAHRQHGDLNTAFPLKNKKWAKMWKRKMPLWYRINKTQQKINIRKCSTNGGQRNVHREWAAAQTHGLRTATAARAEGEVRTDRDGRL